MPALNKLQAVEKLASVVEKAKSSSLAEIHAELFPEKQTSPLPSATALAQHIRDNLEVEEIVDLWNVIFPADRNVWYDDEENAIHFNEAMAGYADTE